MKTNVRKKDKNLEDKDFLPSLEQQKEYILNNFDFDRVVYTMSLPVHKDYFSGHYGKWTMAIPGKTWLSIPSVAELQQFADTLLTGAIKHENSVYISHCGPFRVIKYYDHLILDFIIFSESYE